MRDRSDILDLSDIQGNILLGYRSFGHARFLYFRLSTPAAAARTGIGTLLHRVTPGHWGKERPKAAVNLALSFAGLCQLDLPADCLASFPAEFQAGMAARASVLGDVGGSAPVMWDPPWQDGGVHMLVTIYAETAAKVAAEAEQVIADLGYGATLLPPSQDCAVLPAPDGGRREPFGFLDGLSNPEVAGEPHSDRPHRHRRKHRHGKPAPLAAGEFILGQVNEGGEVGILPVPHLLIRNGTFLVLRKLYQQVGLFRAFLEEQTRILADIIPNPAPDFLAAKMIGRWPNGTPLVLDPDAPGAPDKANKDFDYADDPEGTHCPIGAHIRRTNPRDSLGFDGTLVDRHRLIRRGIPYVEEPPEGSPDEAMRGLMFLAFNASIAGQFEFVQQQWIEYGDDFGQGNDKDPVLGSQDGTGKMVVPGDVRTGRRPFICAGIPRFVTVRGGEYFFVPSLTALDLIARNQVRTSS